MIFDSDVKNYGIYLYRAKMLVNHYNPNVNIKGYLPMIGKDTGDYPSVIEISNKKEHK